MAQCYTPLLTHWGYHILMLKPLISFPSRLWYSYKNIKIMATATKPEIVNSVWYNCSLSGDTIMCSTSKIFHDDVIKRKLFLRYWTFVRGIHWPSVNSPPKGHWRGALMFSLICAWTNDTANNGDADDLRRHRAHYDITVIPKNHAFESALLCLVILRHQEFLP